jgi:hypothetical protein
MCINEIGNKVKVIYQECKLEQENLRSDDFILLYPFVGSDKYQ